MADIKFRCPECTQKIAVAESATGVKIDCPTCHSRLVIPRSATAPVEVLIARKLAISGGTADAVYAELQKVQAQAEKAAEEIKQLRAESVTTAQQTSKDLAALASARDSLTAEIASLRPLREQLAKAQKDLAAARERDAQLEASRNSEAALRAQIEKMRATHVTAEERLSEITAKFAALERERDELAVAGAEGIRLKDELEMAKRDTASAQRTAASMEEAHRAQLDAARGVEAGVRAELAGLQSRFMQAETLLGRQAEQITELQEKNAQLTASLAAVGPLQEQFAATQEELGRVRDEAAAAARDYQGQLENVRKSEADLRTRIGELEKRDMEAEGRLAEQAVLLADLEWRNSELRAVSDEVAVLRVKLADAEKQLEQTREDGVRAAHERDDALARAHATEIAQRDGSASLQSQLADAERRISALTHGFNALKEERQDLATSLEAARTARDENATLAAGHQKSIDDLTVALNTANSELGGLRDEANRAADDKRHLDAELEKFSAEKRELLDRSKGVDAEVESGRQENARLKELLESAEGAARIREDQIQKLLDAAETDARSKEEQIHQLTAKNEALAGLRADQEKAARDAIKRAEDSRTQTQATQERLREAERAEAEAKEGIAALKREKAALADEVERRSTEIKALISEREVLKNDLARGRSEGGKSKGSEKQKRADSQSQSERETALEAECDALKAEVAGLKPALERAKQHVGVLQTRRDMLRDEIAALRKRFGIRDEVTAEGEKPIAK